MAQTCDLVSTSLRQAPLEVFHKQILRSAVPPPDASVLWWNGHQDKALTAAQCRSIVNRAVLVRAYVHREIHVCGYVYISYITYLQCIAPCVLVRAYIH